MHFHRSFMAAAAANRLYPPRLTTLAVFSSPTPNPFSPNRRVVRPRPRLPPISISMDPALVDPAHLQALMLSCAHSCFIRLSEPEADAQPVPVDIRKLRTAIAHSFLVVSVFCGARFLEDQDNEGDRGRGFLGLEELGFGWRGEKRLVGFGRAVSDVGLTASIHDIVVIFLSMRYIRHYRGEELAEKYLRKLQGYSIAEVFMTFLCYVQERRGPFLKHVDSMMMQWVLQQ